MSTQIRGIGSAIVALGIMFAAVGVAEATTLNILYNFGTGSNDGIYPEGSLALSGGVLYGTTIEGGDNNDGTVFSVNTNGTGFTTLHSFTGSDGVFPVCDLLLTGGYLYGTTGGSSVNYGTVFKIANDGSGFSTLHSFSAPGANSGGYPGNKLTMTGGVLYGMTSQGGDLIDNAFYPGTIFKVNTIGKFTGLSKFNYANGGFPSGGLTRDSAGTTLYGMTSQSSTGAGTIFSTTTGGAVTTLFNFPADNSDGGSPVGNLTLGNGVLYGMANWGGAHNDGTIFSYNTNTSEFTLMHSFNGTDGQAPWGDLTLSADGSHLYGMTFGDPYSNSYGDIFEIGTDGSDFRVLYTFQGGSNDGANPYGGLTLSGNGKWLYGMTSAGGLYDGGVVFSIRVPDPVADPVPEPSTLAALPFLCAFVVTIVWRRRKRRAAA